MASPSTSTVLPKSAMGKSTSVASVSRESGDDSLSHTENGTVIEYYETKRGLSSRHVQLMAIGGSIGTGLFVGIGSYLRDAGPLSLFLGYLFYGILFIWPTNLCVGEMCAYLPIRGSIFELAARYIDPAFGFAMYRAPTHR